MNSVHRIFVALAGSGLMILTFSVALAQDAGKEAPAAGQALENIENAVPAQNNNGEEPAAASGGSLWLTFRQGGFLMWPILLLGILGLTIVIERSIFYVRSRIWDGRALERYMDEIVANSNAHFREELEDEIEAGMRSFFNRAEKGLGLLNGVGNLAPILGFFGTVQGMIAAFASIASATTVNAKVVAVGIQIALITTAGGLSVAVPTLAFFHFFIHLMQNLNSQGDELLARKIAHLPRFSEGRENGQ